MYFRKYANLYVFYRVFYSSHLALFQPFLDKLVVVVITLCCCCLCCNKHVECNFCSCRLICLVALLRLQLPTFVFVALLLFYCSPMSQNADSHRLFIYLFMYYMHVYACVAFLFVHFLTFYQLLPRPLGLTIAHGSFFLIAMLDQYDMSASPHRLSYAFAECAPKYSRVLKICRLFCRFLLPLHVELFIM